LTEALALRRGETGEEVRDLQLRLATLGAEIVDAQAGLYDAATERCVRAFQETRGLRVDGICGPQTWAALVESGYALGDRLLYLRRPMLRGDDVAELQGRLNALGFDAGREDGILGPATARALTDFQRNAGLGFDGICGATTVAALARLGDRRTGSVAEVREREGLRSARRLEERRVYLWCTPGLQPLGAAVSRGLAESGAEIVLDVSGELDSVVADDANRYEADVLLALRLGDRREACTHHFGTDRSRSESGLHLAGALLEELASILSVAACPEPKRYAILRETRMTAVVCQLGLDGDLDTMGMLVSNNGAIARAVVRGVRHGVERPIREPVGDA
jgi:N-acetylmuramoyl-L-alanine amidase